ncbi:prepilin-type N-terminal cleavage/methylation domain-containing protein [Aliidiomarina celeris]|uniref:prepilin-type N-terminal cleavage/methylation domain-containing protein n=1 Tax=Aliidiomarina celeris TaxID=2249428 RepID=UPI000DE8BA60|nr:prepilin-type N-terminal cleavage/methylation domain-containing protein [Aliidiomarina celeris]
MMLRPRNPFKHAAGFTLIELLLVVAIIGFAAFYIVLQLPDDSGSQTPEDAQRTFQQQFHHAREQALLRNWVIGVEFEDTQYRFFRWHGNTWQPLSNAPLGPVKLPEHLSLTFVPGEFRLLDNMEDSSELFQAPRDERRNSEEPAPEPQVIIFESTEFIPFRLQFSSLEFQHQSWSIDARNGIELRAEAGEMYP